MIHIRKAYPTDAYTLIQIYDVVWKDAFYDVLPNGILFEMESSVKQRVKHLKDQIEENNRIFVALDDDSRIVGFVFFGKSSSVVYNSAAEIRSIYVLPQFQKQGIGSELLQQAIDEIRKLGFNSLITYCPIPSSSVDFFLGFGGERKEIAFRNLYGYSLSHDLIYFNLEKKIVEDFESDWNQLYLIAQENLALLNDINREVAVIMSNKGNFYLGLGILNYVCPIESALSNLYISGEKTVSKILILNRCCKPVLPCGKCRDLLIRLGHHDAEILFDIGSLQTMTFQELNPYYKDREMHE